MRNNLFLPKGAFSSRLRALLDKGPKKRLQLLAEFSESIPFDCFTRRAHARVYGTKNYDTVCRKLFARAIGEAIEHGYVVECEPGTFKRTEKEPRTKLDGKSVAEIRALKGRKSQAEIAKQFQVSTGTIYNVLRHRHNYADCAH